MNGLNELRLTIGERIATLICVIFSLPLVLGGLVAVGESGDTRVLLYSALTLMLFGVTFLLRRFKGLFRAEPARSQLLVSSRSTRV